MWPAVVEVIRSGNAMLATAVDGARPIATGGGELVLLLPANAAFYKKKAEQEEHRRAVADAVRNVTGTALVIRYELASEEPVAAAAPAATITDEEIVRRFVEEFDAQEIDEETDS